MNARFATASVLATLLAATALAAGAAAPTRAPPWPQDPVAAAAAPNVLLIMTDDVGFAASSTFGGPIATPTLDALAAAGIRYNQFNTAAICSPTRAALLTGRNPHAVGVGNVVNLATGYPGYNSVIPKSAATVAEILREHGYSTAMFGKGHITPEWEMSQAGPFDRWPTGLGFEYFYGFLGADTSMFAPALVENTTPLEPPHDDPDYHLERDLASHAISWLRRQHELAPAKPFFVYYATAAAHAPNQAPRDWLERYRGRFDRGWDEMRAASFARQKQLGIIPPGAELTARPRGLPAWDTLSRDQQRLYARFMEAYAAQLAFSDHEQGRVIDELRASGQLRNTLVIYIQGDNGASTEGRMDGRLFEQSGVNNVDEGFGYMLAHIDSIGSADSYPLNAGGWGWALNTPFQYYKRVASHFGGTRNGLVISWPAGISAAGELRSQFHFVSDIAPTILEVAHIKPPAEVNGVPQQPLDGISMSYSFADAQAPSRRHTQVFEMMENLAIYQDGWIAATRPAYTSWEQNGLPKVPLDKRQWELYDIRNDFSEARDLASLNHRKLAQLQSEFWREAAKGNILPIHSYPEGADGVPTLTQGRNHFSYHPGVTRVPESAAPHTLRHSFTIAADVVIPSSGANGVLVTHGGRYGGYAFYINKGQAVFHYNALASRQYQVRSAETLPAGAHRLVADFNADSSAAGAGGTLSISIDGRNIASGRIDHTLSAWLSHTEGFDVGEDTVTPINEDYTIAGSRFSGELKLLEFALR